jgi:putative DNA primase/helicase
MNLDNTKEMTSENTTSQASFSLKSDEVKNNLNEEATVYSEIKLPQGFVLNTNGLYFKNPGTNDTSWICSFIEVLAYTRDVKSENWGRLIRFKDLDGHPHTLSISMDMISSDCNELFGLLLSHGLRITTTSSLKKKLIEFLQNTQLDRSSTCTNRIGWHNSCFILPGGSIPETDEIYLQSDNSNFIGFYQRGTLEEWHDNVAIPCQGNSRLIFALSCAFAAPLFHILGQESGGFNLKGSSSIGKSTALSVAASVWGNTKYIQSWKATGNALEAVAEAHNNALLCLDELGQVDGKEAGEISYMLANGSGKNRMKSKGGLRRKSEWNILFLSTGEISLSDKINESGKKPHAGMMVRMVDIPADAGKGHRLFDTIHYFKDGNTLANHLKDQTSKYFGVPIRLFLSHLVEIKEKLPSCIQNLTDEFFEKHVNNDSDGQVRRVASRFGVVAAGGELAIKLGILPYSAGEAFEAAGICLQSWIEERGGTNSYETKEAVNRIRSFIETNHSSRFETIQEGLLGAQKVINQAGYKRKTYEGPYEYFIYTETFIKEVCKGINYHSVKKNLADLGFLFRDSEGKYSKSLYIPDLKTKIRVIHLTSKILEEHEL